MFVVGAVSRNDGVLAAAPGALGSAAAGMPVRAGVSGLGRAAWVLSTRTAKVEAGRRVLRAGSGGAAGAPGPRALSRWAARGRWVSDFGAASDPAGHPAGRADSGRPAVGGKDR